MSGPVIGIGFPLDDTQIGIIQAAAPGATIKRLFALSTRDRELEGAEKQALLDELRDVEVLFGPGWLPGEFLAAAPNLKWLQVFTAGIDRIVQDGMLGRGFVITNVAGLAATGIAEWAMGGMIALTKQMHVDIRNQAASKWEFHWTGELAGRTVGIVGLGSIGREVARRARAFRMQVIGTRRHAEPGAPDADCDAVYPPSGLDTLLAESDYIVLSMPLTPETRGMIGKRELSQMRPSAIVVNVARGQVIDQDALVEALQAGRLGGAALDVTDPEPLPAGHPLWQIPNVILSPHVSGAIQNYGGRATELFVANLRCYLVGEPLHNVVKDDLGY